MKIRSVEVLEGDGSESTSSDTLDSTVLGHSSSHVSNSNMATAASHEYEKTIGSFAVAMTELHADLRDKTNECEALYETAHNLSTALQESDRLLQEKTLECERLLLKLQMVTFVETSVEDEGLTFLEESYYDQKEEEDYTIPQRPAAILDSIATKYGGKKVLSKPKPETFKSRKAATLLEDATVPMRRPPSLPVCVDDEDDASSSSEGDEHLPLLVMPTVDRNAALSAGPRQAHFYHVIVERDMAVQTNKKMSRELKYTRAKIRDLKAKLERSTALVELSYTDTEPCPKDQTTAREEKKEVPTKEAPVKVVSVAKKEKSLSPKGRSNAQTGSSSLDADDEKMATLRRRGLPWLRKQGLSVRQHQPLNESIAFISQDEMLSSNWNKTDDKLAVAASEEKYLHAVTSDADRAGGHVNIMVAI